jgi:uncharacterized OB-fold protein
VGPVPYGFGVVELPEGVRVVTRITEPDPHKLEFGQPMTFVLIAVSPDDATIVTYAFAPESQ